MRHLRPTMTAALMLAALAACQDAPDRLLAPGEVALARSSLPTWEVNTLDDMDDGECSQRHCSLREAIAAAFASGVAESRITFPRRLNGTIVLEAPLTITGPVSTTVSIEGPGADRLHLSANDASRVLALWAWNSTLRISGLTIRDGNGVSSFSGGAIFNGGTLALSEVVLRDNRAQIGGAIDNRGTLRVERSSISGSDASLAGGAIATSGTLFLDRATISGNTGGFEGGAIYASGSGDVSIISSTLTRNSAGVAGGAIWLAASSTISQVGNSIIGGNLVGGDETSPSADCSLAGQVETGGLNLIVARAGCEALVLDAGDAIPLGIFFERVLDRELRDNGGTTLTHALLETERNPAIDLGRCAPWETVDQRGFTRPVDLPGYPTAGDGCDIGAFELQPPGGGGREPGGRGPGGGGPPRN